LTSKSVSNELTDSSTDDPFGNDFLDNSAS
jgi:hypothetical protein